MRNVLPQGTRLHGEITGTPSQIDDYLSEGGQGQVYRVQWSGSLYALKWYFESQARPEQYQALRTLVQIGPPTPRFIWPIEVARIPGTSAFGYLMHLLPDSYVKLTRLMNGQVTPTQRNILTAGIHLAQSFHELHARGLCYRDISWGNVFLRPDNGEVLIIDNDNVGYDRTSPCGVLGTPKFIAPEVLCRQALPSADSDRHSLAVLLFYLFFLGHPLDGAQVESIPGFDLRSPEALRVYGQAPIFIFDTVNPRNRPVPGIHDAVVANWIIFPMLILELFERAFTVGLASPAHRVFESEWIDVLTRARDALIPCAQCREENFYDPRSKTKAGTCWGCRLPLITPPRIRFTNGALVVLNADSQLFPHHIDPSRRLDFGQPVADLSRHPSDPNLWGLRNLSHETWQATSADGRASAISPGRSVRLAQGTKIHFGKVEGELQL
jgi:DNA-binding helix-hairpin-helix protein with protein kinase domain